MRTMEGTSHNAWERQQKEIERIRLENPSLLERDSLPDPDQLLAQVGITGLDSNRPRGYLRYLPQDFIVEEIRPDGSICSIEPTRSIPDDHTGDRRTLYCNLIKVNLSTLKAIDYISDHAGIKKQDVGYAGIKDAIAVTSQRISLRSTDWKNISQKKIPNVVLEPVEYGSGVMNRGELKGNRFTILVRSDGTESNEQLKNLIDQQRENGFLNYFGLQRFGMRLEGPKIGCLLARGDMNGAIRELFTHAGPNDLPIFRQLRERLSAVYGDWEQMKIIMEPFPYSFERELRVVQKLIEDPKKTINALRSIRDAVRLYVRGYTSWVVNKYLSENSNNRDIKKIILPFSEGDGQEIYEKFFKEDGVTNYAENLKPFESFINFRKAEIDFRIIPEINRVTKVDEGIIFNFSLGKGSYATTFLMNFYKLVEGEPVPGWLRSGEVDTKMAVRCGDIEGVKKILGKYMVRSN